MHNNNLQVFNSIFNNDIHEGIETAKDTWYTAIPIQFQIHLLVHVLFQFRRMCFTHLGQLVLQNILQKMQMNKKYDTNIPSQSKFLSQFLNNL